MQMTPIIRPNISNTMFFGIVSSETTLHQPRSESAIVVLVASSLKQVCG